MYWIWYVSSALSVLMLSIYCIQFVGNMDLKQSNSESGALGAPVDLEPYGGCLTAQVDIFSLYLML